MAETSNDNPLRAGMRIERAAPPCAIVIFGATGDLTKRKLLPALYRLSVERLPPAEFAVIGVAREQKSDEEFRTQMRAAVSEQEETEEVDEAVWQSFAAGLFYISGDFSDAATFKRLSEALARAEAERHTAGNRIYYLATAPDFFGLIAKQLGDAGMARPQEQAWTRIIVEKPFGHDLESARALNEEEFIARIDIASTRAYVTSILGRYHRVKSSRSGARAALETRASLSALRLQR